MSLFRLDGVHFAYEPGHPVLSGADFALSDKERVVVAGPNGAGKTTLFHLMVGLIKPASGTIWAYGAARAKEGDFNEVRRRTGLLFQDSDDQLFSPTVLEDVAFGPLNQGLSKAEARARALQTLAELGLSGFEDRITHKLSGGQKRLVALASILVMRPDVLLLDEPTNALDQDTRARLTDILLALPQAMVIVSHDADFAARMASRTVTLEDGKLVA